MTTPAGRVMWPHPEAPPHRDETLQRHTHQTRAITSGSNPARAVTNTGDRQCVSGVHNHTSPHAADRRCAPLLGLLTCNNCRPGHYPTDRHGWISQPLEKSVSLARTPRASLGPRGSDEERRARSSSPTVPYASAMVRRVTRLTYFQISDHNGVCLVDDPDRCFLSKLGSWRRASRSETPDRTDSRWPKQSLMPATRVS